MSEQYTAFIAFIKQLYAGAECVPLHAPVFAGNEKKYLAECIDSTFVSYVGKFVTQLEEMVVQYTGAGHALAVVNGTAALQVALLLAGVKPETEVITQALTFVATPNAIRYCGAEPVFLDVDEDTLGLSPEALRSFLKKYARIDSSGKTINSATGRILSACMPMHTFGHPARINEIVEICDQYAIPVVEDSAESLGSFCKGVHTGITGRVGVFSFNGNKVVTTGGGGVVVTNDAALAQRGKHLTTTAKVPHKWEFVHDELGYNFRMPNLNAAVGCAQLEVLDTFITSKRATAQRYQDFCTANGIRFFAEPSECCSNYWLNAIVLDDFEQRERFLAGCAAAGVQARPIWRLMNTLPMYKNCMCDELKKARWFEERVVNIPSSVRV